MADYNVNMKQWNGTSFDNVLPLAYNAKNAEALAGSSLGDIQQWVQDNGLLLYTGNYVGTGKYGSSNATILTFPFEPTILFFPSGGTSGRYSIYNPAYAVLTGYLSTRYLANTFFRPTSNTDISIKKSSDGKTISFYGENESAQKNESGVRYYFAAIASPVTEWTITTSGNWIVPRTGKYYLELYGGGGVPSNFAARQYSGGSSCQSYDSVSLAAGDSIAVSIGVGGTYASNGSKVTAGTGTTFGSYSVAAGGNSTSSAGGKAAGNKGAVGNRSSSQYSSVATFTSGVLYTSYGLFYGSGTSADTNTVSTSANDGAVYLKYLGS